MHCFFSLYKKLKQLFQWLKALRLKVEEQVEVICNWLGYFELAKILLAVIEMMF
jgi:hypothetical protein